MMSEILQMPEPELQFRYSQTAVDPRDGLRLFGPLDLGKPYGIRTGIIGTREGLRRLKGWIQSVQRPILRPEGRIARPPFPGFESVFGLPWKVAPGIELEIDESKLRRAVSLDDGYKRVYETVGLYAERILEALRGEERTVDLWCLAIPEYVYRNCRPLSRIPVGERIVAEGKLPPNYARELQTAPSLFPKENVDAIPYQYQVNFHHQLKARLLPNLVETQIVRESTIAYQEFKKTSGRYIRDLSKLESAIAWHLSTAAFYKAGGRPWKVAGTRPGVCYVGLVFKVEERAKGGTTACSGAQMFLDTGDGMVFKGAVGPWYSGKRGDFHLSRTAAQELVAMCVKSYAERTGRPPKQMFIHGRVRFGDEEWAGFEKGAGSKTSLVGVLIRPERDLKVYRRGDHPPLRGLAYVIDGYRAYLWTKGFVPRLMTYPGREVPLPLHVEICRGKESITTVLSDILALTKLNYNACVYSDGVPVTLKFANAVGEILSAGPVGKLPPLPFKFYI